MSIFLYYFFSCLLCCRSLFQIYFINVSHLKLHHYYNQLLVNCLFLENEPFVAIQQIFYLFFTDFFFVFAFNIFYNSIRSYVYAIWVGDYFSIFGSIYGNFIIRWNMNIVTKVYFFDDTIRNFFYVLSWNHQINCLQYICLLFLFYC